MESFSRHFYFYPRKALDIDWKDLFFSFKSCLYHPHYKKIENSLNKIWAGEKHTFPCLSVRTGFDLLLKTLNFEKNSEIIMTAITIPDMVRILSKHSLRPVPVDVNIETLTPNSKDIEKLITPKTKAILITHLFGAITQLEEIHKIAKKHNLLVIEDCSQAFTNTSYKGHNNSDISMFSFGPIKKTTALGGALFTIRDYKINKKLKESYSKYTSQTKFSFLIKTVKYSFLKTLSNPFNYNLVYAFTKVFKIDFDQFISKSTRGFSQENMFSEIRKKPSASLLSLLNRRIRLLNPDDNKEHISICRHHMNNLPYEITKIGRGVENHSFWLFPALFKNRREIQQKLKDKKFDITSKSSNLILVNPNKSNLKNSSLILDNSLFLPIYRKIPKKERERLSRSVNKIYDNDGEIKEPKKILDNNRLTFAYVNKIFSPKSEKEIRDIVRLASKHKAKLSVMGKLCNIGGHSFSDNAWLIDLKGYNNIISLSKNKKIITVQSGILWEKIQAYINQFALSVLTMQSSNQFTVGGSLGANIHGRDIRASTIIKSIESFRIVLHDGTIKNVSRKENYELFKLAIGGYGLFGIITEIELKLTDNEILKQKAILILPQEIRMVLTCG
ncbi:aminotransferase class V-fold PLP-dependent enzyme [Candidatus Pacearchaeota archaeon]|nr:aminotransferase class V-fold PLP-dependent enzyme [Candidatus Pacearchaeota archaeon]